MGEKLVKAIAYFKNTKYHCEEARTAFLKTFVEEGKYLHRCLGLPPNCLLVGRDEVPTLLFPHPREYSAGYFLSISGWEAQDRSICHRLPTPYWELRSSNSTYQAGFFVDADAHDIYQWIEDHREKLHLKKMGDRPDSIYADKLARNRVQAWKRWSFSKTCMDDSIDLAWKAESEEWAKIQGLLKKEVELKESDLSHRLSLYSGKDYCQLESFWHLFSGKEEYHFRLEHKESPSVDWYHRLSDEPEEIAKEVLGRFHEMMARSILAEI